MVTLTGKFILAETSLCLICLSHQMHGFLANASSLQLFAMALPGDLDQDLSWFPKQYPRDATSREEEFVLTLIF